MKPILSRKVTRTDRLMEWESAAHQSTTDGLMEFKARQEARRIAAQTPLPVNVKQIQRKAK